MPTPSTEKQPKVVHKLLVRTLILVLVLGGIVLGIQRFRQKDASAGEKADTAGWISAIEYKADGTEAVAIKPDQSITRASGWADGVQDRDVVWAPNGNFLFFISDRTDGVFHVFRWNPLKPTAEVRTLGNRGRSNPTFKVNQAQSDLSMLITSGGVVMDFDPSEQSQVQVLPPSAQEIAVGEGDEAGAQSQFAAYYGQIGNSFRYARYCGKDDHIAAIMRRDDGEILIVQDMRPKEDGSFDPPIPVAAGERIELDVNPANGDVVFSVNGFQFPGEPPAQAIKDGKIIKPFRHYIGFWTPTTPLQPPIVASPDDKVAFGAPAVRPTGDSFVVVVGPYRDGAISRQSMVSFPIKVGGAEEGKAILRGEIYEPSWDPKGNQLVYAKREGDNRTVYTAAADGTSERSITAKGRFGFPRFSPQTP